MALYYQPANRLPRRGVLLFLVGGGVAAVALAFGYAYALWYCRYVAWLLCLAFGGALGAALAQLVRRGKLRSPRGAAQLALLVGLAAVYLEWSVYLALLTGGGGAPGGPAQGRAGALFSFRAWAGLLVRPSQMAAVLEQVNRAHIWSLDRRGPGPGPSLVLFWAAEAAVIVGGACLLARARAQAPFSEATDAWALRETMPRPLRYAPDRAALRTALEAGRFDALRPCATKLDVAHMLRRKQTSFARLALYQAPGDAHGYYLTLVNFERRIRKGLAEYGAAPVVEHLAISAATHAALKQQFGSPWGPGGAV